MEIRKPIPLELVEVKKIYKKYGCQWEINYRDYVLIAKKKNKIIGIIRINEENGYPILQGLLIEEAHRKQGMATKLLNESEQYLQGKESYCVPNVQLKRFYKQLGYEAIEFNKAPKFLKKTLLFKNKPKKYSNLETVIIMRKPNN